MKLAKRLPENASQHTTAGPYSPVLEITCSKLIVISGQASLDLKGNVIGTTIEEQTEATLNNCLDQLNRADCSFEDVFKVNVFLTDLDQWGRFNAIYEKYMPQPYPVRTAVGAALLSSFLVEIEMWAAKK